MSINHGKEEPAYDGKAYTYSATYNSGTASLALYAHHVTPPAVPGGLPEYHMTEVKAFAMGDRDTFIQGATWFRNARDRAKRIHDSFIQAANARARQSDVEAPPEAEIAESPDESVDCEDRPGSQAVGTEDDTAPEDVEEPATNFTSRVNQSQTGSKRSRASHRPPAISQPRKQHDGVKKRALRSASRRAAGSSA
ncbi:hypothetical protein N0V85_003383 [Neurospora sp. IMI 360204]|nr:hypothetical protein N0V85_003383 [Neurospora sp. IMI 360204]